ncbi:Os11g0264401 [Oryza sativa Japonica Group]|uniref:Os11g0264401 protein n=1 Tax=Oryza sativa subsp. japonica TaxID=39947 RepID=A0A0P0Y1T9_ORYSJ|nr:Os11g0264401 [Oryza sativa Japonica Group]
MLGPLSFASTREDITMRSCSRRLRNARRGIAVKRRASSHAAAATDEDRELLRPSTPRDSAASPLLPSVQLPPHAGGVAPLLASIP